MPAFNQDPISRSRGVRSSARAHLARLREDRLQKRQAALPVAPAAGAVACDPSPPAAVPPVATPVVAPAVSETATLSPTQVETVTVALPRNSPDTQAMPPETTEPRFPMVAPTAIQPAPATQDDHDLAAIRAEPEAATAAVMTPAPAEPMPDEALSAEPEALPPAMIETVDAGASQAPDTAPVQAEPSDLAGLPGAGPGLIWLLQDCGVTCLAELAAADAAELSEKLGLVGQLLDLEHWIAHARANS